MLDLGTGLFVKSSCAQILNINSQRPEMLSLMDTFMACLCCCPLGVFFTKNYTKNYTKNSSFVVHKQCTTYTSLQLLWGFKMCHLWLNYSSKTTLALARYCVFRFKSSSLLSLSDTRIHHKLQAGFDGLCNKTEKWGLRYSWTQLAQICQQFSAEATWTEQLSPSQSWPDIHQPNY